MAETEAIDAEQKAPSDMPSRPDLSALFQEHARLLNTAYKQSSDAFKVFTDRDTLIASLTNTYQLEITQVLTLAQAVTTPQTALASVPVVLATANAAFAQAPIIEQTVTANISEAFSSFKSDG